MSTFYNPSMMQMYASQGYAPPEDEYAQVTGMEPQTQYGGNQMGYQPGSQNNALVGSGMNPYMLDTFGMGQYYRPYGNLAQQQQVPQQPYYQVPTEYIPEGTPGLNQNPAPNAASTQPTDWVFQGGSADHNGNFITKPTWYSPSTGQTRTARPPAGGDAFTPEHMYSKPGDLQNTQLAGNLTKLFGGLLGGDR